MEDEMFPAKRFLTKQRKPLPSFAMPTKSSPSPSPPPDVALEMFQAQRSLTKMRKPLPSFAMLTKLSPKPSPPASHGKESSRKSEKLLSLEERMAKVEQERNVAELEQLLKVDTNKDHMIRNKTLWRYADISWIEGVKSLLRESVYPEDFDEVNVNKYKKSENLELWYVLNAHRSGALVSDTHSIKKFMALWTAVFDADERMVKFLINTTDLYNLRYDVDMSDLLPIAIANYTKFKTSIVKRILKLILAEAEAEAKAKVNVTNKELIQQAETLLNDSLTSVPEIPSDLPVVSNILTEKYYKFRGYYSIEWVWLLWLQKCFGKKKLCTWPSNLERWLVINDNPSSKFGFQYNIDRLVIMPKTLKAISKCLKKSRFTVCILEIVYPEGPRHANAIIFDSQAKRLTRFEPNGSSENTIDTEMKFWLLSQKQLRTWTYSGPTNFCPKPGPQSRENWMYVEEAYELAGLDRRETGGFCAAWSLLWIHMRLENPDLEDQELVDKLLRKSDRDLSQYIRLYAEFVMQQIESNKNLDWGDRSLLQKW